MEKIVCAIRGGESSRRAQERAIALGQERDALVIFVHIIDLDLIERMQTPLTDAVLSEMENIGSALLNIAVERSQARGVKAEKALRRGPVGQTLTAFLHELQPTTLVMGSPDSSSGGNSFTETQFNRFVEELRKTTEIDIEIAQ